MPRRYPPTPFPLLSAGRKWGSRERCLGAQCSLKHREAVILNHDAARHVATKTSRAPLIAVAARSRCPPAGGGGAPGRRAVSAASWAAGRPAAPPPRIGRPAQGPFVAACRFIGIFDMRMVRGRWAGESSRCEDPAPTGGVAGHATARHVRPRRHQQEGVEGDDDAARRHKDHRSP